MDVDWDYVFYVELQYIDLAPEPARGVFSGVLPGYSRRTSGVVWVAKQAIGPLSRHKVHIYVLGFPWVFMWCQDVQANLWCIERQGRPGMYFRRTSGVLPAYFRRTPGPRTSQWPIITTASTMFKTDISLVQGQPPYSKLFFLYYWVSRGIQN